MNKNINHIAESFRRTTTVKVPMPMLESLDMDKVKKFTDALDQQSAAQRHLDVIDGHIATHAQMWPSDVGRALHGHNGSETVKQAGADHIKANHEKQIAALPDAAKPAARLLMSSLIKHAHFMHGVCAEAKAAADAAAPGKN